ncbi:type IX secretion system motor protein PorM/GldM [Membranihabitans marinus]|uniref:type IX secretion system motor protein PorM/GldM n=1 Tax=Membranihabitans marinus TaxID=1227546 RepID=UPI001F376EBA|nr:gliding motility protein GldM [Membranihabitans marinus]
MSIPKEPRQLMINIMYLVLTAMLALNVSAEIFNAFKVVDKGLKKSNDILDVNNSHLPPEIAKLARKKDELAVYAERTKPVQEISKEFSTYVDEIVDHMIEETGGYLEDGSLKGYKNKDITTRFLVNEGKGDELEQKIAGLEEQFLQFIDPEDRERLAGEINLEIDESWKETEKMSWADFNFRQMPLLATLPIFSKIKNDVKSAEATVLNYLMNKVGGEDIVFDKFQVVMQAKKGYVIKGEPFEADFFLSSSASANTNTKIDVAVNGQNLPVNDGVATFRSNTSSTGVKDINASITVTNPITGEKTTYSNSFTYEVGERSASVSADKMNVLYVGVDNPLSITASGISSNDLKVAGSGSGIKLAKTAVGKYNATVSAQGGAKIVLSGGGLAPTTYEFRTKLIPDPIATLSGVPGGKMGNGTFKVQRGLIPELKNFDFDARCNVLSFSLLRSPRPGTGDAAIVNNNGSAYESGTSSLVSKASPGDIYLYENIRVKCPGWPAGKVIGDVIFKIQ